MKMSVFQEKSRRVSLKGDRDYSLNTSERNVLLGEHNKNTRPRDIE
mgnify:CR=1 FL=1